MTTWLITGCSTGFGRHLAEAALDHGINLVATARDPATVQDLVTRQPERTLCLPLDVTDPIQVKDAVAQAEAHFGGIDVLVNNAGYGYRAAIEEGEVGEVEMLFATNFFGTVAMIKAVLPGMRARRSGSIVNFSSIAGRLSSPGSGYYAATKFAVEGISDALRKEVGPLGIRVLVVEPGAFRTDFAGRSLTQARTNIADYADTAGRRRKENDKIHGTQPGDPTRAARTIIETLEGDDAPFRLLLGSDAIKGARRELQAQQAELDAWEQVSSRTDFPLGS